MAPTVDDDLPVTVVDSGAAPRFWSDRNVIFFANLLSLFFGNRDGARLLRSEISCVDSYGGRLLPLIGLLYAGGENVLVLERHPEPSLVALYRELGLPLPEIEIVTREELVAIGERLAEGDDPGHPVIDRLAQRAAEVIDGFVTDETIARLAQAMGKRTLSTFSGSHRGNNKLLLHRFLEESGLPVPPTRLAADESEVAAALEAFRRAGFRRGVAKAQVGASGIGLMKLPTEPPFPPLGPAFFHEGPCLVQGWLAVGEHGVTEVRSPSVQIFVGDDAISLYDLTEQILEDSIHQGNESPPPYLAGHPGLRDELFRQAGQASRWLHAQGYRGTASADFILTFPGSGGFTAYLCEINARVTGATYPSVLARHFHPAGCWRMRNLELRKPLPGGQLLDKLRDHSERFDPARGTGILPVNFNLEADGLVRKGQFLAIGDSLAHCRGLLDTARHDLPVEWDYTKDR